MPRKAFTLLELLLATSLLGVTAATICAMMRAGFVARRAAAGASGQARSLVLAVDHIAGSLQSAMPPRGLLAGAFVGEDDAACDSDVVTFHAVVDPYGSPWGDVAKLEFRLEEDAEGDRRLVRVCTRNLLSPRAQEGETEVLCRRVKSLDMRYFDGTDWYDDWDSTDRGNLLPAAVEVVLVLDEDEERPEWSERRPPSLRRVVLLPCSTGQEASR